MVVRVVPVVMTLTERALLAQAAYVRADVARRAAWREVLVAAAVQLDAGQLSMGAAYDLLTSGAEAFGPGFHKLWSEVMPIKAGSVRHTAAREARDQPNGNEGSCWVGDMDDLTGRARPPRGQAVVYILLDRAGRIVYIGSSGDFASRLAQHRRDKPGAVRWVAFPHVDRAAAYAAEDRLIKRHLPPLSSKIGR